MKKILVAGSAVLFAAFSQAQQKEGKVTYQRVAQIQVHINNGNDELQNMLPKTRTDNFELAFGNNQSLWKQAEKEPEPEANAGEGGFQIRMFTGGSDDALYNNFQ